MESCTHTHTHTQNEILKKFLPPVHQCAYSFWLRYTNEDNPCCTRHPPPHHHPPPPSPESNLYRALPPKNSQLCTIGNLICARISVHTTAIRFPPFFCPDAHHREPAASKSKVLAFLSCGGLRCGVLRPSCYDLTCLFLYASASLDVNRETIRTGVYN